ALPRPREYPQAADSRLMAWLTHLTPRVRRRCQPPYLSPVQARGSSSPLLQMHANRELVSDRRVDFVAPASQVPRVGCAPKLSQTGVLDQPEASQAGEQL